ncbi:MAG: hypothetical protein ACK4IK_03625 [Bacteroidia bacterium]
MEDFEKKFNCVHKRIKELNKNIEVKENYFPIPFKTIAGKKYDSAKIKIAYIGLETKGWEGCINFLNQKESFTENLGGFWDLVLALHLKIKKIELGVHEVLDSKFEMLNDFVWGNLNVLENTSAILKRNKTINKALIKEYIKIKTKSEPLNKLKFLLEKFQPEFIFILSWQKDDGEYFEGVDYYSSINKNDDEMIYTYIVNHKNKEVKVIWTCHPSFARRKGYSVEEFAEKLYQEYLVLNKQ